MNRYNSGESLEIRGYRVGMYPLTKEHSYTVLGLATPTCQQFGVANRRGAEDFVVANDKLVVA